MERVFSTLAEYRAEIDRHHCERNIAVLTSAVRDASNGEEFAARVRDELRARRAGPGRRAGGPADIPGGDVRTRAGARPDGRDRRRRGLHRVRRRRRDHSVGFHVSLNAGVVRMSERHIQEDPPRPAELERLAADVRSIFSAGLPARRTTHGRRRGRGGRHRHLGCVDRPAARPLRPGTGKRLPAAAHHRRAAAREARGDGRIAAAGGGGPAPGPGAHDRGGDDHPRRGHGHVRPGAR